MSDGVKIALFPKILIGIGAGIASTIVKYFGQDHEQVQFLLSSGNYIDLKNLGIAYIIMLFGLGILGVIFAVLAEEETRWKLFIFCIAAPALVTTYAGGDKFKGTYIRV